MSETSPSAQIVAAATRTVTVTDALGRQLEVKRLIVSERLRFLKAVPADLQANPLWLTTALTVASVVTLDGVPVPMPANEASIERAGDRLGDEGMEAAQAALETLMAKPQTAQEAFATAGK